MKELLLAILIACSLGLGGCTEDQESTGNKQLDDALGVKTEEKIKEPKKDKKEKKEEKKTEKEKSESKIKTAEKKKETKTETKKEYKQSTNEDVAETAKRRNFVISTCYLCEGLIHEDDNFKEYNGHYLCKKCYNKGYVNCMDCGKRINYYSEETYSGSAGTRCKECERKYEEKTSTEYCSKCGKKMKIANTSEYTYDDNGNIVCLDCYFAENDQIGDSEFAD